MAIVMVANNQRQYIMYFLAARIINRQRVILKTALEQLNIKDMDFMSIYESKSRNEANKLIFKFFKSTGLRTRI